MSHTARPAMKRIKKTSADCRQQLHTRAGAATVAARDEVRVVAFVDGRFMFPRSTCCVILGQIIKYYFFLLRTNLQIMGAKISIKTRLEYGMSSQIRYDIGVWIMHLYHSRGDKERKSSSMAIRRTHRLTSQK